MLKVSEEHLEEAMSVLQDSVVPVLRESGFGEILVLARRRQLEKLDPQGLGVVDSPVLRRLLERAPPDDPGYASDLRELHRNLTGGISGVPHAMSHHNKKERRPEEYEAMRRELYAEENRLRVAGYQLDCYALYKGEADLKADTLDLEGKKMLVPHSARFLAEELDGLLFLRLQGYYQTVIQRALPGSPPVGEGLYATVALIPVLLRGAGDAGERIRRFIGGLASRPGFAGSLVLRSRPAGFSGGFGWSPIGLKQHRGDEPDPDDETVSRKPLALHELSYACELLTLWLTEDNALAGAGLLAGSVSESLGDALPSEEERSANAGRHVLSGLGELVLRA
jgi:hypothetical protein